MKIAQKHLKKHEDIKENINQWKNYYEDNFRRFNECMRFVFYTTLDNDEQSKLATLKKPAVEANYLEGMISRLCGEFMSHEPSIITNASDGLGVYDYTPEFLETMKVIEAHVRDIMFNPQNDELGYNVYRDLLGGGFSVVEVYTEYLNDHSFDHRICLERVFDPCLTGFDPLAKMSHKGDGQYCFKIYPLTLSEFTHVYGEEAAEDMKFNRQIGEFTWSYQDDKQKVVLVADYYEKVPENATIFLLTNGHVVTEKQYENFLKVWEATGKIEQPPRVLHKRKTSINRIHRYRLCETGVLEHQKTNFDMFPLIFIDGNSVQVRESESGYSEQITRPYIFQAKDLQKVSNFCLQTVAAHIENIHMGKWVASVESIPEEYKDAYTNPQLAQVLVYNQFYDKNPEVPLTPPREVVHAPIPQFVESLFMNAPQMTQALLGSHDSLLGGPQGNVSGRSIEKGAIQSNAAAKPFLMGYIKGLNRIAEVLLDLIPKYYTTPRTIPITLADGTKSYRFINKKDTPGAIMMNYDPKSFMIKIEAGVSSTIQKQVSMDQLMQAMQAMPAVSEFINTECLELVLDNLDLRNIEAFKEKAHEFTEKRKQMQAQPPQPTPEQEIAAAQIETVKEVEMAKVEQRSQEMEMRNTIDTGKLLIEKQRADAEFMEMMAKVRGDINKDALEQQRIDAENAKDATEVALKILQDMQIETPTEVIIEE